ncbi:MAG TPA: heterodisulfide reductase-related iron-sulfur binding cluster [Marmoricola sp.]|nr:heterodisulfide reductase-related iron-sulfur binding cluster [Marmoricola sp.]
MLWVLILGLLMNVIVLPLAALRVRFLYRATTLGQPAPDRVAGVTGKIGTAIKRQIVEVFGQKKMLKWTVPGAAHFFVMWAFFILATVYLEAYGSLFKLLFTGGDGHLDWAIPLVGTWPILGFLQDFIAVMALFGLVTFYVIRLRNAPKDLGRRSRFFGSHLGPAYLTLFMIFNVIWTMFLFRGASSALGNLPYESGAFASIAVGNLMDGLSEGALEFLEGVGLLLHIGVMLAFLLFVLNSKHLHIFLAPLNVLFGREPKALGSAKPMMSDGKPLALEDLEDLDEDSKLGVGAAEDFSWKGILDFNTCTECGRCQSQCPAWNTEKPLSPKLLIMALRDHTMAKAPYLLADEGKREALVEGDTKVATEVERPLVGDTGDDWFYMPDNGAGVIDPDVLWSCVTCGACVEQCPVDIEHVDHIIDMRRHQVLVESNFPSELNGLFKGLENKGNPWNMSATARMDWAKDLPFDVKVVGEDVESLDDVEWLFWVGCAGAYEDRAKKTTRAVAELLDMAGVEFAVLGNGETCNGDSARRAGNEFLFQGLAQQNIETFKEYKVKKVVSTCAHCFNTLKNEYRDLGYEMEVVHHTQLLNRLVREKKLTPVVPADGGLGAQPSESGATRERRTITYHDPCYIGRHNGVYSPPRELLNVIPDAELKEMPRNSERSFCCGAGGARMWMEETIGSRINETRTAEAVATGADQIAVGCPFCRVMLSDGLTAAQSSGQAREEVEVLDVAQMLLASVKGEVPKAKVGAAAGGAAGAGAAAATATITEDEATKAEPGAGDATQTDQTVSDTEDVGAAAKASSGGGGSLFDLGGEDTATSDVAEGEPESAPPTAAADKGGVGAESGSLFDLGGDEEPETPADADDRAPAAPAEAPPTGAKPEAKESADSDEDFGGGSLFDLGDSSEDSAPAEPKVEDTGDTVDRSQDDADADVTPSGEAEAAPAGSSGNASTPSTEIPEGGSLFDIAEPEETTAPAAAAPAEPKVEDTGDTVDRSQDEADADVAPSGETEDKGDTSPATSEETASASAPAASSGAASTPATEIPEGGSLFDIAEPEETTAPAAAAPAEPEVEDTGDTVDRSQDEADADVAPSGETEDKGDTSPATSEETEGAAGAGPGSDSGITSLKDIKAKYADGDSSGSVAGGDAAPSDASGSETGALEAEAAADSSEGSDALDESADEGSDDDTEEKPKPASSGEAHQPRTDTEIGEGGSLFDL